MTNLSHENSTIPVAHHMYGHAHLSKHIHVSYIIPTNTDSKYIISPFGIINLQYPCTQYSLIIGPAISAIW